MTASRARSSSAAIARAETVVVDVLVGHEAHGTGVDGADAHVPRHPGARPHRPGSASRCGADDVGLDGGRDRRFPGTDRQARRRGAGPGRGRRRDARPSSRAPRFRLPRAPRPGASRHPGGGAWSRARSIMSPRSAQHRSRPARSSPFDRQNISVSTPAHSVGGRHARRHCRVPDARTVDVHREARDACGGDRGRELGRPPRSARRRHVRVLDRERGDRWQVVLRVARDRVDLSAAVEHAVGVVEAVGAGYRSSRPRHPTRSGTTWARAAHSTSCPCAACSRERELVRHRARRHEAAQPRVPSQRGGQRLQPIDGGVLAVRVVADLGVGHRPPHLGRRRGDGVGPEVDDRLTRLRPAFRSDGSGPPGSRSPPACRRAGTRTPRPGPARPMPTG